MKRLIEVTDEQHALLVQLAKFHAQMTAGPGKSRGSPPGPCR